MRILIVERDKELSASMRTSLYDSRHSVEITSIESASESASGKFRYDLALWDLTKASNPSFESLRLFTALPDAPPVILMSELVAAEALVKGLELGADD